MSTRRETIRRIAEALRSLYPDREALQIARILVAERSGLTPTELLVNPDETVRIEGLEEQIAALAAGRPLQYVLGYTEFCGLRIGVREGVLIPRPETEELVMRIVRQAPPSPTVLDIGTGSGCIAIALDRLIAGAEVHAVDLSERALAIACENAAALGSGVRFFRADALGDLHEAAGRQYDIIVSNPPYVPAGDRLAMRRNVTGYEPAEALFVPDDDPLRFYRAIARSARRLLRPGGSLWLEIDERQAEAMHRLLACEAYEAIEIYLDMNDKPRMAWCRNA
ncbi:peptide chain release factor N(5)-glutamine methyltransferase [uncultured Alistipes sp.]|jgi:protein-(glutamine-N5) methyltransferase, release factor-specific|uniref:peptide chain release factor N(5)-glutamine methyltransferase n=1 Tax=Alistipes sp. TaxID=1872444 RepID=UPI00266C0091|nr:peptide chain release factor N(5)-glutamine methyltransferase [uncultured Alistipes sp.]